LISFAILDLPFPTPESCSLTGFDRPEVLAALLTPFSPLLLDWLQQTWSAHITLISWKLVVGVSIVLVIFFYSINWLGQRQPQSQHVFPCSSRLYVYCILYACLIISGETIKSKALALHKLAEMWIPCSHSGPYPVFYIWSSIKHFSPSSNSIQAPNMLGCTRSVMLGYC
jgi:hypothetical protein